MKEEFEGAKKHTTTEAEPMENQSSDEGEPIPPMKPVPQKSISSKDTNQDEKSCDDSSSDEVMFRRKRKRSARNALTIQETKKPALGSITPNANVVWSESCDDKEKERLRTPISDVTIVRWISQKATN